MVEYEYLATFVLSLLTILNPFGSISIYLGVTKGSSQKQNVGIAFRMCIAVACILILSIWAGAELLNLFGISIVAFRISGGLVVAIIALRILGYLADPYTNSGDQPSNNSNTVAIVPLAIPVIAGPGAIITTISHSRHYFPSIMHKVVASITCLIVISIIFFFFVFAPKIANLVGKTKIDIFSKIMGLLLLGVGIEMIVEAINLMIVSVTSNLG